MVMITEEYAAMKDKMFLKYLIAAAKFVMSSYRF